MNQHMELGRLQAARRKTEPWKKWGPYLSERQWGTVREDFSAGGDAWNSFTYEQAGYRAYRWGEDGLAGISDEKQRLCFALALWNGRDPHLKERLFGLTNSQGNHGEDVKEYYFYLDSTPTHSYMRYLYKYPQAEFPYGDLIAGNARRGRQDYEYELLDTGVFEENRYFDVQVDYAKQAPEELLVEISVFNRGPEAAELTLLPTLWFRNTWASWSEGGPKPSLRQISDNAIAAEHEWLGLMNLSADAPVEWLFTDNETNNRRVFGSENDCPYVKDGIDDFVVAGRREAVNPDRTGTKAAALYRLAVEAGQSRRIRLRLSASEAYNHQEEAFRSAFDRVLRQRQREADDFYQDITPADLSEDRARVMRQALAGMLWTKQYYCYNVLKWLRDRGIDPRDIHSRAIRNKQWFHANNDAIISMPDKWEYPWYASWDLAFHTLALSMVDLDFSKEQLDLLLREEYLHPNGQIPAYEWNFGDVNPPVHAWASLFVYNMEKQFQGYGDLDFLKRVFGKLTMNFTWWVNRKDRFGQNVFEGGFLGLDNIGVFDRSAPLPTGGYLEQADGTAWMAMYCQNLLDMAIEIASYDPVYEDLAKKFVDHFLLIAEASNRIGGSQSGLWDEEDGFYYDVLRLPDGQSLPMRIRSLVGLLPLCATTVVERYQRDQVPSLVEHATRLLQSSPALWHSVHPLGPGHNGVHDRQILALMNRDKLEKVLARLLDEKEFLSAYGIRSLSRVHADQPYVFRVGDADYRVNYLPAESDSGMFGGNSNWRGPIWMPMNALIIRALLQFYLYYGDDLKVECPTGSGVMMNLFEVSREITRRLEAIFLRNAQGRRPVFGGAEKFQQDPHWRDHMLFYEYFHGDNGAGLGASHQTGWSGLIARLIQIFGSLDAETYLREGRQIGLFKPPEEKVVA